MAKSNNYPELILKFRVWIESHRTIIGQSGETVKRRPRISNFKKTQKRFQSIQIIIKCITPDLKDFKDCNQEILFNSRPKLEIIHFLEMFKVIFTDFRTELKFRTDRFDSASMKLRNLGPIATFSVRS